MTPTAIAWSVFLWLLLATALAGVMWRGRWRASWVLPAYLLVMCADKPPMWFWPDHFYNWGYWLATELVEALLRLLLAVELLMLVFGRLPIGRRRAGWTAAAILAVALACIAITPAPESGNANHLYEAAAQRAAEATLVAGWLFAVLIGLSVFYRLPLDPLHRDLAAGLALWAAMQAFPVNLAPLDPYLHLGRRAFSASSPLASCWPGRAQRGGHQSPGFSTSACSGFCNHGELHDRGRAGSGVARVVARRRSSSGRGAQRRDRQRLARCAAAG